MQASVGELLGTVLASLVADGEDFRAAHASQGWSGWFLTALSVLALLAVGGIATRVATRLVDGSTSELTILLNGSATFYARWPEYRLAAAPRGELVAEAARCRRIIELLERRSTVPTQDVPTLSGCVDGLRSWVALLSSRIASTADAPTGASYA
ncbi:MAG: hypothetical protein ABW137_26410 [Mycobacterium sp.]